MIQHYKKKTAFEIYRAMAVSMVVLGHFCIFTSDTPTVVKKIITSFTSYGVAMFFIISGYLLSASFISILQKNEYHFRTASNIFLFKRILRIYPAYLVSLIILSIFYGFNLLDFTVHLFNVHNLFDGFNRSINVVYWSLAVEFQWYLIAPIVILFFTKINPMAQILLFSISIIVSILMKFNMLSDFIKQTINIDTLARLGHDQLYIHFFNFLIGVLLYRWRHKRIKIHTIIIYFLLILIFCINYIKEDFLSDIMNYREATAQYKLLLDYVSILILAVIMFVFMDIELKKRYYYIISFISTISYSLYIYHVPILHYVGNYNLAWYLFFPIYLSISIFFATISYYLIEARFLKYSVIIR